MRLAVLLLLSLILLVALIEASKPSHKAKHDKKKDDSKSCHTRLHISKAEWSWCIMLYKSSSSLFICS